MAAFAARRTPGEQEGQLFDDRGCDHQHSPTCAEGVAERGAAASVSRLLRDEQCACRRAEHEDAEGQVREQAVDGVGDRRVRRVPGLVAGAEHKVVDEQLGAPVEQLAEGLLAVVRVESVLLLHRDPRQLAPLPRELAASGQMAHPHDIP
jgi:hypothetical protein